MDSQCWTGDSLGIVAGGPLAFTLDGGAMWVMSKYPVYGVATAVCRSCSEPEGRRGLSLHSCPHCGPVRMLTQGLFLTTPSGCQCAV